MTDVFIKRGNLDTDTVTQREDGGKGHRGKPANYKPRGGDWNRCFRQALRRNHP